MSKLFSVLVSIEFDMPVEAPNRDLALEIARKRWRGEMGNIDVPDSVSVSHEITELRQVPADWLGTVVYGPDGSYRTPEEILAERDTKFRSDPREI